MTEPHEPQRPDDVAPDAAPDVTPDATAGVTPDVTPDVTADVTADATPDATPEVTPALPVDTAEVTLGGDLPGAPAEPAKPAEPAEPPVEPAGAELPPALPAEEVTPVSLSKAEHPDQPEPAQPEPPAAPEPQPLATDSDSTESAATESAATESAATESAAPVGLAGVGPADVSPPDVTPAHEEASPPAVPVEAERPGPAQPDERAGRGLLRGLVALVVVLVVLAGAATWAAVSTSGRSQDEKDRRAALTAAREAARVVFSYDYRHLDKDFAAGKAVTTGDFRKEYEKTTKRIVDDVAPRYKAVVAADVSAAAVVRASDGKVVTLVFLNQQSTSTLLSNPKVTQSRLEMTMARSGDAWVVEKIKAL